MLEPFERVYSSPEVRYPCPNELKKSTLEYVKTQVEQNPDMFGSKIEDIANNEKSNTNDEYGETDVTLKRDIELSMYMYLKILWDRWLVSTTNKKLSDGRIISYQDYYNVENFYNSFIFIDAFYLNIYKKLQIIILFLM